MGARWPIRDGEGGKKSETSKQAPTQKTKAAVDHHQNNKMLWQCLLGIAQQLPYHAVAVPTAMRNRVTKTMSVAPPLRNNWSKTSPTLKPSSASLPLISSGLTSGSSTTSLLLISPGPAKMSNFFMRVQLTFLLLILPGIWMCSSDMHSFVLFGVAALFVKTALLQLVTDSRLDICTPSSIHKEMELA